MGTSQDNGKITKIKLMMVKVKLIYLVYFMDFIIWSTVGRYLSNKSGIVLYTMVYVVVLWTVYTSISANSDGDVPVVNTREHVVALLIVYFSHSQESINLKLSLVELRWGIKSSPYSSILSLLVCLLLLFPD